MFSLRQILHPNRLADESQFINKIGAEIILIIDIKEKTDRLIKNGLNFRNIKKPVTFFQETNLRAICYKYCNIRYDKLRIYRNRFSIQRYKKDYNTNNQIYNIINYKALKERRCLHDFVKCGNHCQAKRPRPTSTHSIATYILTLPLGRNTDHHQLLRLPRRLGHRGLRRISA